MSDWPDDIEAIRGAVRRLYGSLSVLTNISAKQSALIAELEAQHEQDDKRLALMEARSATEHEVAENTRQQLIWTQQELNAAQQVIKNLEVSAKDQLESALRRANAKENAMLSQINGLQEEIARLKRDGINAALYDGS